LLAQADKPDAKPPAKPTDESKDSKGESKNEPAGSQDGVGTEVELHFGEKINHPTLTKLLQEDLEAVGLPSVRFDVTNPKLVSGSTLGYTDWTLNILMPPADTAKLLKHTQAHLVDTPVFPSSNRIGGKVAGKTQLDALWALIASLVIIVIYVWIRFQNLIFGVAAVLALIHDVLVTVGFLALSKYLAPYFGFLLIDDFKISLAVVAALLTIVGYSINDTIVIFDRIREVRGKNPDLTEKMINDSVNQTLSRTFLTSGTVVIGTLILYFMGGVAIHPFAFAMLVGLFSGTFSTVYIASPVLLWLKRPFESPGGYSATPQASASR
jgi:SecD/SecF fusion protein